jgi:hypothetical protein
MSPSKRASLKIEVVTNTGGLLLLLPQPVRVRIINAASVAKNVIFILTPVGFRLSVEFMDRVADQSATLVPAQCSTF